LRGFAPKLPPRPRTIHCFRIVCRLCSWKRSSRAWSDWVALCNRSAASCCSACVSTNPIRRSTSWRSPRRRTEKLLTNLKITVGRRSLLECSLSSRFALCLGFAGCCLYLYAFSAIRNSPNESCLTFSNKLNSTNFRGNFEWFAPLLPPGAFRTFIVFLQKSHLLSCNFFFAKASLSFFRENSFVVSFHTNAYSRVMFAKRCLFHRPTLCATRWSTCYCRP